MNSFLRYSVASAMLGAVVWLGGCTVEATIKPLTRYNGSVESRTSAWVSGKSITVRNDNGDTFVQPGSDGANVVVSAKPFTMADDAETGKSDMQNKLELKVENDGSGNVVVSGIKKSGVYPGYNLIVSVPPGFDSAISVNHGNGSLEISGVDNATDATVLVGNGDASMKLGKAAVNVTNDGAGDMAVYVDGTGQGKVLSKSGVSDVFFHVPAAAKTSIQAWAKNGQAITVRNKPDTWVEVAGGTEASKTFTCNGGNGDVKYEVTTEDASGFQQLELIAD